MSAGINQCIDVAAMTDTDLAAHLAEIAGRILVDVRTSGLFSPKALGKAGDQTANQFLCHALRELRPEDGLLSEEEKDNAERLDMSTAEQKSAIRRRKTRPSCYMPGGVA